MTDEPASLSRLIKLLKMTASSHDPEALSAVRMANREAEKFGGWEKILSDHITVIGDPFAELSTPKTSVQQPRPKPAPRPASTPAAPAWSQDTDNNFVWNKPQSFSQAQKPYQNKPAPKDPEITVILVFHGETPKAVRVSLDGDITETFWLPKSQIQYKHGLTNRIYVNLPEWLFNAKKKTITPRKPAHYKRNPSDLLNDL